MSGFPGNGRLQPVIERDGSQGVWEGPGSGLAVAPPRWFLL